MSLRERCYAFEQRFVGKKIATSKLRRIYREYGIIQKSTKQKVHLQPSKQQQIKQQQQLVYPNVVETFEQQKRLFFVDESMYTTRLYEQKVWCRRG